MLTCFISKPDAVSFFYRGLGCHVVCEDRDDSVSFFHLILTP